VAVVIALPIAGIANFNSLACGVYRELPIVQSGAASASLHPKL
jgi:hypothetical protein